MSRLVKIAKIAPSASIVYQFLVFFLWIFVLNSLPLPSSQIWLSDFREFSIFSLYPWSSCDNKLTEMEGFCSNLNSTTMHGFVYTLQYVNKTMLRSVCVVKREHTYFRAEHYCDNKQRGKYLYGLLYGPFQLFLMSSWLAWQKSFSYWNKVILKNILNQGFQIVDNCRSSTAFSEALMCSQALATFVLLISSRASESRGNAR